MQLHVGRGTTRGALTIFPLWSDYVGPRGYSQDMSKARVAELAEADVNQVEVTNLRPRPLLVLEGHLLEGGWQHRMVARSTLVAAQASDRLPVMCVEHRRWGGARMQTVSDRRASYRVRDGLRMQGEAQHEVWRRVASYEDRFGTTETGSFAGHLDSAEQLVDRMVRGLRPLSGQMGLMIGIAGQPIGAEIFDSPLVLRREFRSILRAAAMDALGQEEVETPSRRARGFADRLHAVQVRPMESAGLGFSLSGQSDHASVRGLGWLGRPVHPLGTNVRHELVAA